MVPSTKTRGPNPRLEKQLQTIILPPLCFTVGTKFCCSKRVPEVLQTRFGPSLLNTANLDSSDQITFPHFLIDHDCLSKHQLSRFPFCISVNKGFCAGMREKKPRLCNDLWIVFCDALILVFFSKSCCISAKVLQGFLLTILFITCSFSPSINFGRPGRGAELVVLVTLKRTKILWTVDFGIPRTLLISLSLLPALDIPTI